MLNKEAIEDFALLKSAASQMWGADCIIGELMDLSSPYPEFFLPLRLYGAFDVMLEYENSSFSIMVKTSRGYIGLNRLTDEQVFRGLLSFIPENLLHNFKVLDKLLRKAREDREMALPF